MYGCDCQKSLLIVAASFVLFGTELFVQVSAERNDIHVIPDERQTSLCPARPALCYTLNGLLYTRIKSNTTVTLLPGVHQITLSGSVHTSLSDNIVIVGQNFETARGHRRQVVIECVEADSGFEFNHVNNLTLANLTIRDCILTLSAWTGTIHIVTSMNVFLQNISVSLTNVSAADKYGVVTDSSSRSFNISGLNLINNGIYIGLPDRTGKRKLPPLIMRMSMIDVQFASINYTSNPLPLGIRITIFGSHDYKMFVENASFLHSSLRIEHNYIDPPPVEYETNNSIAFKNTSITGSTYRSSLYIWGVNFVELEDIDIIENFARFSMWITYSVVKISGRLWIHNNTGGVGVIQSRVYFNANSSVEFFDNIMLKSSFELNLRKGGGLCFGTAMCVRDSKVYISKNSHIRFERNCGSSTGGLILIRSTVTFNGTSSVYFIENKGRRDGGAMALYEGSQFLFTFSTTTMIFERNEAQGRGGAIYVDDSGYIEKTSKILSMPFISIIVGRDFSSVPRLEFVNNTASIAGSMLYGGWIDWFDFSKHYYKTISQFFHFHDKENDTSRSMITSNPTRVCICSDAVPNCSVSTYSVELFPGEMLVIEAVAVGQRLGPVPAVIQADFQTHDPSVFTEFDIADVGNRKQLKNVAVYCTPLSYEVLSVNRQEQFVLSVVEDYAPSIEFVKTTELQQRPNFTEQFEQLSIVINLKPCAPGFFLNYTLKRCTCQQVLLDHNIQCDMTSLNKVHRTPSKWINVTTVNVNDHNNIIVHDHCPLDYCIDENQDLDLLYPDSQCAFNRIGILCGACPPELSGIFGTPKCKKCSHVSILLIPVFALLGLLLVVLVFLCNLTITVGAVNGLIFYANIVRANQSIFFTPETNNSFPSWFIAWINLDFGIEACFYDGMDAYAKTWLQFLFPLYIWFIVLTIILLSRRFDTVAKLCGNNAVPVLATLFLLSYAKLLQIIITAFQQTHLDYPDGNYTRVWLKDGNVDYLKGKHIPLFIAALLLLLFISLPYTAILLTIQWLQKWSEYRVLFWVNRLKPLFDAYTGPYKDDHRYWTGLLLLIRVILILVFSLNILNNPSMNLIAICIIIILMCVYLSFIGGVYKSKLNNLIELSFILNLGVLSVVTFYHIYTNKSLRGITNASVSIALITFIMIILKEIFYRCFLKSNPNAHKLQTRPKNINELKLFIEALIPAKTERRSSDYQNTDDSSVMVDYDRTTRQEDENTQCTTTTVHVQLREPLLDHSACEEDDYPTY